MADTTTTTMAAAIHTEIIDQVIKAELGSNVVVAPLARFFNLDGQSTRTQQVAKWVNEDANVEAPIAEGTSLTPVALDTTSVTIAAAEAGISAEITDRLLNSNVVLEQLAVEAGQFLTRALARQVETDLCTLFSSFSTSVGVGTSDLADSDLLSAIYNLENVAANGPIVWVGHPLQAHDLRKAWTINVNAADSTADATIRTGMDINAIGAMNNGAGGLWTTVYNVPLYITNKVVLSVDDYHAGMFIGGSAIGLAAKYLGRVETDRDVLARTTIIAVVSDYGVGEIEDSEGVRVISDSTN